MKKLLSLLAVVLTLGLTTVAMDAEAKRLGGGKSFGMQRQATPPAKAPDATPNAAPAAGAAAGAGAAAAAPKRSWMGPIAGLAAGLGLDYALFFDHAGDDRADQLRTLHAVIVCSLTTALVFGLLALSSIPVLRAIGSTVALGVVGNFVLAVLVARSPAEETR